MEVRLAATLTCNFRKPLSEREDKFSSSNMTIDKQYETNADTAANISANATVNSWLCFRWTAILYRFRSHEAKTVKPELWELWKVFTFDGKQSSSHDCTVCSYWCPREESFTEMLRCRGQEISLEGSGRRRIYSIKWKRFSIYCITAEYWQVPAKVIYESIVISLAHLKI